MIDTHCSKCGRACYEWWEVSVSPSFVNVPGRGSYRFCGKCFKEIKQHFQAEAIAPPQKAPLCLSCANASFSVTDDFADCLCAVRGGYEGGKTECKDYERKGV